MQGKDGVGSGAPWRSTSVEARTHTHARGSQANAAFTRASDAEGSGEAAPAARLLLDLLYQRRDARPAPS